MDAIPQLVEARLRSLEKSRDRSRLAAWALGLLLVLVSTAAMIPQAEQELTTERLILRNDREVVSVVLLPGPGSSLIVQNLIGDQVARIGGPPVRRLR